MSFTVEAKSKETTVSSVWYPSAQEDQVFHFDLAGDFDTLFAKTQDLLKARATAEQLDAIYVPGYLAYRDAKAQEIRLEVNIRTRGYSSLRDCSFAKLEVEFKTSRKDTVFTGSKKLKIGTHCGEDSGTYNIQGDGRLRNELSPHREALVYRILEALEIPVIKVRPAMITYLSPGATPLTRKALLLESTSEAEERLGAQEIFTPGSAAAKKAEAKAAQTGHVIPGYFNYAAESADIDQVARAYIANALIGNGDFVVTIDPPDFPSFPLWNMKAFIRKNGSKFIMPYDFDLSMFVASPHITSTSERILEMAKDSAFIRHPEALTHAKEFILSKRPEIFRLIEETPLPGDEGIRPLLKDFFVKSLQQIEDIL